MGSGWWPPATSAPEKDWAIVKDAETKRAARIARQRQLREAYHRIAERERELYLAREAYRHETSRIVQVPQPVAGQQLSADESKARVVQGTRLQLAERRVSQGEREAYKAKLEYGRAARAVREQRRSDAGRANADADG